MSHAWRALRHRNFKLFFVGQSISLIGTWMTRLATGWLVYRLTAFSAAARQSSASPDRSLPSLVGPFAGVWVERLNRRKLLVWTQAAAAVQSLAMAALTLAHVITLWRNHRLTALQGLINAFDMPARQSFLVQMVEDRSDLGNAIAINSSMANGARLIGPAIAGMVIAAVGEGWCFLIDGVSYFAVIASLLLMRITLRGVSRQGADQHVRANARGMGLRPDVSPDSHDPAVLCGDQPDGLVRTRVLLPVFAGEGAARRCAHARLAHGRLRSRRAHLGDLARGAQSVVGLTRMLQIAAAMLGIALILFGLSHTLWLSLGADGLRRVRLDPERIA